MILHAWMGSKWRWLWGSLAGAGFTNLVEVAGPFVMSKRAEKSEKNEISTLADAWLCKIKCCSWGRGYITTVCISRIIHNKSSGYLLSFSTLRGHGGSSLWPSLLASLWTHWCNLAKAMKVSNSIRVTNKGLLSARAKWIQLVFCAVVIVHKCC